VPPFAHIGNIPVEEYAGFVVPVILLYVYARQRNRRDRKALARLPGVAALDERSVRRVLARWAKGGHEDVGREHVALMYPPGPDGVTCGELAERIDADKASVRTRLEDLAEFGYLEIDADADEAGEGLRGWLTVEGISLLNLTEEALLDAASDASPSNADATDKTDASPAASDLPG